MNTKILLLLLFFTFPMNWNAAIYALAPRSFAEKTKIIPTPFQTAVEHLVKYIAHIHLGNSHSTKEGVQNLLVSLLEQNQENYPDVIQGEGKEDTDSNPFWIYHQEQSSDPWGIKFSIQANNQDYYVYLAFETDKNLLINQKIAEKTQQLRTREIVANGTITISKNDRTRKVVYYILQKSSFSLLRDIGHDMNNRFNTIMLIYARYFVYYEKRKLHRTDRAALFKSNLDDAYSVMQQYFDIQKKYNRFAACHYLYRNLNKLESFCRWGIDFISNIQQSETHSSLPNAIKAFQALQKYLVHFKNTWNNITKREPLELSAILERYLENYFLPQNITMVTHLTDQQYFLQGNTINIHRIIDNLIHNALDAFTQKNKKTGTIVITTHYDTLNGYTISIYDNAGGIDESMLRMGKSGRQRLFEAGVSSKGPDIEGEHGIGLSAVYEMVLTLGGRIYAENQQGGALITIQFPIQDNTSLSEMSL